MEILIPIAFFAMITAIVVGPRYFRSQERQKLQETLRTAIEKGQPIPPEVVAAMAGNDEPLSSPASPQRDLRRGVVWLAIALGLAIMGLISGMDEPDWTYHLLALAAVPGVIGAAFMTLYLLNRQPK
jgi:hypothetical protein